MKVKGDEPNKRPIVQFIDGGTKSPTLASIRRQAATGFGVHSEIVLAGRHDGQFFSRSDAHASHVCICGWRRLLNQPNYFGLTDRTKCNSVWLPFDQNRKTIKPII